MLLCINRTKAKNVFSVCAGGPEETWSSQLNLLSSHQTGSEDHQIPAAAQGNTTSFFTNVQSSATLKTKFLSQ